MSELHKFLFDGLPVRGAIVRLDDAWIELLRRRAGNSESGAYAGAVAQLLGEMLAAGVLLQSHLKFDGALVLQLHGDGPVKLAVAEVSSNLALRATASVQGVPAAGARLRELVNPGGGGRCAITLDPRQRQSGQHAYQGIVALSGGDGRAFESLAQALQFYLRQSEQLDATLVLAADDGVAAGLLVQRMPVQGGGNLARTRGPTAEGEGTDGDEDYNRIAHLAASLTRQELLQLDVDTVLQRLFWQENLLRFVPRRGADGPRFACSCTRARVAAMLQSLGQDEVSGIVRERGEVQVGCEYCGQQYRFDAVDAAQLFTAPGQQPPASSLVQ